jgi:type II secretory pathway component PulM
MPNLTSRERLVLIGVVGLLGLVACWIAFW